MCFEPGSTLDQQVKHTEREESLSRQQRGERVKKDQSSTPHNCPFAFCACKLPCQSYAVPSTEFRNFYKLPDLNRGGSFFRNIHSTLFFIASHWFNAGFEQTMVPYHNHKNYVEHKILIPLKWRHFLLFAYAWPPFPANQGNQEIPNQNFW